MILVVIALIIAVCILESKNRDLKEENEELKKIIVKLKKNALLQNQEEVISIQRETQKEIIREERVTVSPVTEPEKEVSAEYVSPKKQNKPKNRNSLILITGSILIVLSAIVFLLSTWSITSDIVKTGVLLLLIGVFLGVSTIADKKFHLEQTSETFYYIAMAYIPIVLLSISIFHLFGDYLSITGEGRYLYFALSSAFLAFLYQKEAMRKEKRLLSIFSTVFQVMSVVFTVLIFTSDIFSILFGILVYNLVLGMVVNHVELKEYNQYYRDLTKNSFFVLAGVTLLSTGIKWMSLEANFVNVLCFVMILLNYIGIGIKNRKLNFIFNLSILSIILSLITMKGVVLSFGVKLFIMSMATVILYGINYLKLGEFQYKIIVYVALNFVLLSFLQMLNLAEIKYIVYIPFVTTLIAMGMEMIKSDEKGKYYLLFSFFITFISLNIEMNMISFICIFMAAAIFMWYRKYQHLEENYNLIPILAVIPSVYFSQVFQYHTIISFILIAVTTFFSVKRKSTNIYTLSSMIYIIISIFTFEMNSYIPVLLILAWSLVHSYFYEKKDIFKVIAYVAGLVLYHKLINDFLMVDVTLIKLLIHLLCTYLISVTFVRKSKNDFKMVEYIATVISYLYSVYAYAQASWWMLVIGVIFSAGIYIYYEYEENEKEAFDILPIISLIPCIYSASRLIDFSLIPHMDMILSYGIIIYTTVRSLLKKKENPYTGVSAATAIITFFSLGINQYVNLTVMLLWCIIHAVLFEKKDLYKAGAYGLGLVLYQKMILDLSIVDITLIKLLGYTVCLFLVTRTLIKSRSIEACKIIEYIGLSIICIYALNIYTSLFDAMLFIALLVFMVILGYLRRIGPMFLVSLLAIIANSFQLTETFWYSIPWWVYLLMVGATLLTFAIRNEASEKNHKKQIGEVLMKLKDKIDL